MASSPFTKYINFVEVIESTEQSAYLPNIVISGAVDENGDPWKPNTWDPLEVVTRTSTSGSTVLGSVLTGTLAEYSGGEPPVEELYQWQRSDTGDGGWTGVTDWTDRNPQTSAGLTYTTVLGDNGKYVRFASKCTDANGVVYGSGNAIGPMAPAAITVSSATYISNGSFTNPPEVYGFEDLTVGPAAFAGGFGTLTAQYRMQKQDAGTAEGSWGTVTGWVSVPPTVAVNGSAAGSKYRAQSKVTDSAGQNKTSNSPTPTVGLVTTVGTVSITPANTTTEPDGDTTFTVSWDGSVVSPMIVWSIRSGPGQIISPNNMSEQLEVRATGQPGATIQVQVYVSDPSSSDSPQSSIASLIINS